MTSNSNGKDFTFSSQSEVKTFVRAQLGMPSEEKKNAVQLDKRIAGFKDLGGREVYP